MADDAGWRVKLYNLDNEGQWSDQGTGHVSCGYVDRLGGTALVVDDEVVKQGKLLEVRIVEDDIYTRQGDTIITWTEPSSNADLALSFEDTEGWNRIWEDVCKVQGRAAVPMEQEAEEGGDFGGGGGGGDGHGGEGGGQCLESHENMMGGDMDDEGECPTLPAPEISALAQIDDVLANVNVMSRDATARRIVAEGGAYVKRLVDVFKDVEDLEDTESLHRMFNIFKNVVQLNHGGLFELLLGDDFFPDVVGALEYNPVRKAEGVRTSV